MEAIHREQQVLIDLLTHGEKEVLFTLANSLWADEGLDFHEAFLEQSKQYYGAEITDLDLQGPEAPEKINGWAKEHTGGKIPQIIDGPFGDQTILMQLNAVYFNGNWANPFEPDATRPETFTRADGSTLEVPMMHNKGRFDYLDGDGFQAVRPALQGIPLQHAGVPAG